MNDKPLGGPTDSGEPDSGYFRLEDQINWYDKKSQSAQFRYRTLKVIQIVVAAFIPTTALIFGEAVVPGALGALILVLEGFQELGSYQRNWFKYRSTCEVLRHEKFLFLAKSGPYRDLGADKIQIELAERVEALISEEHSQWIALLNKDNAPKKK